MRAVVGVSTAVVLVAALAVFGARTLLGPGDLPPLSPAEDLAQARRYGEALVVYEHLAARYPHDPRPYFRIGEIRRAQGLPTRAAEATLLGLARDPQNAAGLHLLGNIYADQRYWTLAEEKLQASLLAPSLLAPSLLAPSLLAPSLLAPSLDTDLTRSDVHVDLGHVFISQQRLDAAQAQMALALQEDDSHAEAHYTLALLVAPQDIASARPHLASARSASAAFAERARTFARALDQVEAARRTGSDAHALTILGAGYLQVDEPILAQPVLLHAARIAPRYADAHAYLGHTWWLLGDARSAMTELDTAIAQDAGYAPAHHWRGLLLHSLGRYDEAIAAFQQALAIQPGDAAVCADLGTTYEAQRDYVAAEEWLQKAAQLNPGSGPLTLRLARFHVEHGIKVRDTGRNAARRATELRPQDPEAWELLGWAYYLDDAPLAARNALAHAVDLDLDRPSAHYRLGVVLHTLEDLEAARREYQLAVDLAPEGPWAVKARRDLEDL